MCGLGGGGGYILGGMRDNQDSRITVYSFIKSVSMRLQCSRMTKTSKIPKVTLSLKYIKVYESINE